MEHEKNGKLGNQAEDWIRRAAGGIRFGPDRRDAEQELREHIADRAGTLVRVRGLDPEEAETEALKRMGDADVLRQELSAVHRPLWGYLWRLSQVLLRTELAITVILILGLVLLASRDWEIGDAVFGDWDGRSGRVALASEYSPSEEKAEVDGWTITMERAGRKEDGTLHMDLKSFCWKPWLKFARFTQRLTAVDSQGRIYPNLGNWTQDREATGIWGQANQGNGGILSSLPHLFTQDYIVEVLGVSPDAEWIRLEYDFMGRSFTMTQNLTGGETA